MNETNKTKAEHLEQTKQRALGYLDRRDIATALRSLMLDLKKHPETENHPGLFAMPRYFSSTPEEVRHYIEGFN